MRLTLLFLGLFSLSVLQAQEAIFKGRVLGVEGDEPALGAIISLAGQDQQVDFETGAFEFKLAAGRYNLSINLLGHDPIEETIFLKAGETLEREFRLAETATLLKTATITSSRFDKPLGEVTGSLEVVSNKLLEQTNAISVAEVLDRVPGVSLLDDQVDIRGGAGYAQGTGSRVMLLLDDMPILQADAGIANWRDLPTENVDQIEVLKGAASTLYGSAAMNGVINVRTAQPKSKPYTHISLTGRYFGSPADPNDKWWNRSNMPYETALQAAHRQRFGKFDLVAGTNIFLSRSVMRGSPDYRRRTFGQGDSTANFYNGGRLTVQTRYRITDRFNVGLNVNFNYADMNRHLFWHREAGDTARGISRYTAADESIPIRGKSYRYTIDPNATYFDNYGNRHRLQTRYYRTDNQNENQQSNSAHYFYGEYQYQRRFEYLQNLDMVAGLVGMQNLVDAEVYGNNTFRLGNVSAYVQLEKKFFERLNLSAGMRYEYNSLTPGTDSVAFGILRVASPPVREGRPVMRFGANYQASEATYVRASWGQAYRFPTLVEKFVSTSAGVLGVYPNPGLTSETGWTGEVGIKQGFKVSEWQGFFDLSGFWSEYQNMMEFQFEREIFGFWVQNVGDTRITGIEASVAGQGRIGKVEANVLAGYTYINPIFINFDSLTNENSSADVNVLKYRFRHTWKLDGQASYKGASLGLTLQYMSFMEAIDAYLENNFPSMGRFRKEFDGGTFLLGARAAYQVNKMFRVSVLGQNLLNSIYTVRPGLLEAPRSASLRLDMTF